jgi:hypothetical protein
LSLTGLRNRNATVNFCNLLCGLARAILFEEQRVGRQARLETREIIFLCSQNPAAHAIFDGAEVKTFAKIR